MLLNKVFEVALGMIPGVGGYNSKTLVSYCGSPESVFRTPRGKLLKIPGIGDVLAEAIINNKEILIEAEKQLELAEKNGVSIYFYTDPDYPSRLKQIHDAPSLLFYKGTAPLNAPKIVGIVGTRKATEYGKEMTEAVIKSLAKHQVTIMSGLAYGIDIAAHKAALQNNLPTIAAMASGLDIIYPASHKDTAAKMVKDGAGGLITEYNFGTRPEPARFPARNRIIAGLCDVLVVVEAAEKGGALITAEMANEYSREVFAVPGNVNNRYSEGCNKLIQKHKAHIFTDIAGFEYIMNWDPDNISAVASAPFIAKSAAIDFPGLEADELAVVTVLGETEGIQVDDLSWKSNLPLSKLASVLLNLEFKGLVKTLPGKKYKLN